MKHSVKLSCAATAVRALVGLVLTFVCASTNLPAQRVVHETAAQWKSAHLITLTPQSKWCVSGDDPGCDFKSIDDVAFLPDGGIVAISRLGAMRRFSTTGKFEGEVARKGEGPGEYLTLESAQLLNDKIIWFDIRQMRVASVGLNGTPGLITRVIPPPTMQMMYLVGESLVVFDVPPGKSTGDTVVGKYHTVPVSGAPRILASIRTPALFQPGSAQRPASGPFAPRIVAHVGVDGTVAHSNGARYQVDVVPGSGMPWRLESEAPPRDVTSRDRDSVEKSALKFWKSANVASLPPVIREQFDHIPKVFPPLANIRVLRDGTLWIRPVAQRGNTSARWDVFGADGLRVGQAMLPSRALVRDGTKDWVLVVELNSDDVPTVVKYKVH